MILLPKQAVICNVDEYEKIYTYLTLYQIGCPVFKSALIMPNEKVSHQTIDTLLNYFKTENVTIRYQYINPCAKPKQGGNRYKLTLDNVKSLQNKDTILWILEPIDRLKNDYGINLYFHHETCTIEIVGKGFDVSDLNRGHISPHQIIQTELPIRKGYYYEWWKFLKYSFASNESYRCSCDKRILKLRKMDYVISYEIFNKFYQPLPPEMLEKLLFYITNINKYMKINNYCVSCSVYEGSFVFWDIQTPEGKKKIYGVDL